MQNNHGRNSWDGRLRKKGSEECRAEPAVSHLSSSPAVCCVALPYFTWTSFAKAKKKIIYLPTLAGDATQDFSEHNGGVG